MSLKANEDGKRVWKTLLYSLRLFSSYPNDTFWSMTLFVLTTILDSHILTRLI